MTFSNIKQQDGKDDGWIMVMILNDPACQMSEVWERRMYYASMRLSVSNALRTPPSCFQVLTTNKKNPISYIYTSGTIPPTFHLSKYIIYIILEYIKYRIGTIPFYTSRVLLMYSNNCWKEQLVCNGNNFSKICWYVIWKHDEHS